MAQKLGRIYWDSFGLDSDCNARIPIVTGMAAMLATSTKVCASVAIARANVFADSAPTPVPVFARAARGVSAADVLDR